MVTSGDLVELMPRFTTVPDPIFALHPAPETLPARVRVVLQHLSENLPLRLERGFPSAQSRVAPAGDDRSHQRS